MSERPPRFSARWFVTAPLLIATLLAAACTPSGAHPSAAGSPTASSASSGRSPGPPATSALPTTTSPAHVTRTHRASPASSSSPGAALTTSSATPSPTHPAPATSGPKPSPTAVPKGVIVTSWNSPKYGEILTGANGHVLYLYTADDATGTPTCTGNCAAVWPPLEAGSGTPRAEGGVQQSKLAVKDGVVTYNNHPLYYYTGDSGADQTNGQGSGGFYVVETSGNPNTSP